uniref:Ubiquinol oxidase n=1 Tax=Haematococcus lacustris TaxID=44745 RepID=A5GZV5_HAELA|nr:plastid terminal oxidase [Haematococcus lacustris]
MLNLRPTVVRLALGSRNPPLYVCGAVKQAMPNYRQLSPARQPLFAPPSMDDEELGSDDEECAVYVGRDGKFVEVMCCDYGYRAGSGRMYNTDSGTIPMSGVQMAVENFVDELACLRRSFRKDDYGPVAAKAAPHPGIVRQGFNLLGRGLTRLVAAADRSLEWLHLLPKLDEEAGQLPGTVRQGNVVKRSVGEECAEIRQRLSRLILSNHAVSERERVREAIGGKVEAPWYVRGVYNILCLLIDVLFENRPIQRFWFLETVARMPYFSYISCLHLYESLGWWRAAAELRKLHFAEEWNELHHLQIMESLGGDQLWFDRFVGYHSAIVYYWVLVLLYVASPSLAYTFSELLEAHAVDTYGEFLDANEPLLKSLAPPLVAAEYYRSCDLYLFDEFQTSNVTPRNPPLENLYDVFCAIKEDEGEHVKTMHACVDSSLVAGLAARKDLPRRV